MIHAIITSYNEPKSTLRASNILLKQLSKNDKLIVCDPFPSVKKFLSKNIKDKRFSFFLDPGEGKSYALNLLFNKIYSKSNKDIIILTDGDVYVSENTVKEIVNTFKDEKIGVITSKVISLDSRKTKYGYWSHVLFDMGANRIRKKLSSQGKFFECSGYLFAIRNNVIKEFPLETSEDSIIPYLFYKKNYKIKYLENVSVYVKNPSNWKDWVNQRVRNIKAHENLNKFFPDFIRTKSLFNEIKEGSLIAILYPRNLKEFIWTIELYFARLYIYLKAFSELRNKKSYADGWRENEIKSTKTLD